MRDERTADFAEFEFLVPHDQVLHWDGRYLLFVLAYRSE